MNFVEVSINICVALLAAVIFGGLVAAVITSLAKPSPEVVRHFPLTLEQQNALKELRESASLESQVTPVATYSSNAYAEQAKKREKLVGQNTLRFVIQHVVHNETGLKHWFDFNQYTALDQLFISARLLKHA